MTEREEEFNWVSRSIS